MVGYWRLEKDGEDHEVFDICAETQQDITL